jgi:hypothetical protein
MATEEYTGLNYRKNLDMMKELNTQAIIDLSGRPMSFECFAQEYLSKFSVTNQS